MTVYEIVVEHLKAGGYDGLCGNECGCRITRLAICDRACALTCQPAILVSCGVCRYAVLYPPHAVQRCARCDCVLCHDCLRKAGGRHLCPTCRRREALSRHVDNFLKESRLMDDFFKEIAAEQEATVKEYGGNR